MAPTIPSLVGTYTLKATYTPTNGSAAEFSVLTITVQCVVTSMTRPANPTTGLTYNVWDKPLSFDFSKTWVQTPACGYVYTDSFTWTGLNTYILQDSATPGRINVVTSLLAAVNTYTISLQNTITISNNGGSSSTFAPTNADDKVSFVITIVDPCRTTTVNTLTVSGADSSSPYSKSVGDGSATTVTFVRPTTAAEASNGIVSVCGSTSYTVHSSNAGANFSYNA